MSPVKGGLDCALRAALITADATDKVLLDLIRAPRDAITKADGSPLTRADLAVEDTVYRELSRHTPGAAVFGEESSRRESLRALLTGEVDGWIVDPIDHTRHFIRGDPEFGTLLAYVREGRPVVAVISAPSLGIRGWAQLDGGTYINGALVHVSNRSELERSEVAFAGFAEWTASKPNRNLQAVLERSCYPHGTRGGFLQHLRVAQGLVDVAIEPWGEAWDLLPGALIVTEAGGRASALDGGRSGVASDGGFVVSNGIVHDKVLALLSGDMDYGR
ncbi:inositol monophosphatase family protein [Rhodococcus pyridinivorans]|uniref:Inositol monophosphatase n=1 Tax=Rhodococcus pyridinivorans TaxID=103816 RepID=A0A7M2XY77_9NOCA|nr:inositol monophosphatase [Rhodococcus pyridinivorans]QOW02041.1 inositol monophosphatase [Rhodococcus pyridinivorans]